MGRYEGVFSLPLGPGGKSKGGVKKIKLGRNEGRGAGLVAGTGEPEAAQERESRSGAETGKPGWCCPARRGGGQKK